MSADNTCGGVDGFKCHKLSMECCSDSGYWCVSPRLPLKRGDIYEWMADVDTNTVGTAPRTAAADGKFCL